MNYHLRGGSEGGKGDFEAKGVGDKNPSPLREKWFFDWIIKNASIYHKNCFFSTKMGNILQPIPPLYPPKLCTPKGGEKTERILPPLENFLDPPLGTLKLIYI